VNPQDHRSSTTTVNLGFHLSERLHELAREHDRDLTGEARHAVRLYLRAHAREAPALEPRLDAGGR
jgi:predicted transcriptional regulator